MGYTPINELPAPPAFMLKEAEEAETQYIQELAQQVMTIKEARELLLPIIAQANESPVNKVFRKALECYKTAVFKYMPSWEEKRRWNYKRMLDGTMYYYDEHVGLTSREYNCGKMRDNAEKFQDKQIEKFCSTKSGNCPRTRLQRAYKLRRSIGKFQNRKWLGIVKANGEWSFLSLRHDMRNIIGYQERYFKVPNFWKIMEDFKKNKFSQKYIDNCDWYELLIPIGAEPMVVDLPELV